MLKFVTIYPNSPESTLTSPPRVRVCDRRGPDGGGARREHRAAAALHGVHLPGRAAAPCRLLHVAVWRDDGRRGGGDVDVRQHGEPHVPTQRQVGDAAGTTGRYAFHKERWWGREGDGRAVSSGKYDGRAYVISGGG